MIRQRILHEKNPNIWDQNNYDIYIEFENQITKERFISWKFFVISLTIYKYAIKNITLYF